MNVASAVSFLWDTKLDFPSDINRASIIFQYPFCIESLDDQHDDKRIVVWLPDSSYILFREGDVVYTMTLRHTDAVDLFLISFLQGPV